MWWISCCSKLLFIFQRGTHGTHKNCLMTVPSRSQNLSPVPSRVFSETVPSCPVPLYFLIFVSCPVPGRAGKNPASRRSLMSMSAWKRRKDTTFIQWCDQSCPHFFQSLAIGEWIWRKPSDKNNSESLWSILSLNRSCLNSKSTMREWHMLTESSSVISLFFNNCRLTSD